MMQKPKPLDLVFGQRPPGVTLTRWLYGEIRNAVLDGRLRRGAALPPTRQIAAHYQLSRRIVVNVFDQLRDEGYLTARTGSGTRVSGNIPEDFLASPSAKPAPGNRTVLDGRVRPFIPIQPAVSEFPIETWARLEMRSLRTATAADLAGTDPAGNRTLRVAIAEQLGSSRGVICSPDEIIITSGTQQSLDLIARVIMRRGDRVLVEDPGFEDAVEIFKLAGAKVIPAPVDDAGVCLPRLGRSLPQAMYVTPAHQFPLGVPLRLDRRLELLQWTREHNIALIEDDYDSEFRFTGRPIPAMKGLAGSAHIFLLGTFSKTLFPSLRIGYVVAPARWIDPLLRIRRLTERFPAALPQRTLAAFINEGHFARHLRRMRQLYGSRLLALRSAVKSELNGAVTLPEIEAGLNIPAFLIPDLPADTVAAQARTLGLEAWTLGRFAIARKDLNGLLLGFAPFTEPEIRHAVEKLARVVAATARPISAGSARIAAPWAAILETL